MCVIYDYITSTLREKNKLISKLDPELKEIDVLISLTSGARELAILGRKILSINQGMKVGDYEE
jgi:hypothetical protein